MAEVYDIMLDEDMDLRTANGDFVIGESTEQHQQLLVLAEKGSFVAEPLTGVGLRTWLSDDTGRDEIKHAIQGEVERDGMTIEALNVAGLDSIELRAGYE